MHEFSLVSSIMEHVVKTAEAHGNRGVEKVLLEIGALQHVSPEALVFAFDALKKGTVAENAELAWHITPACIRCSKCGAEYEPSDILWVCPSCGAAGGHPIRGEEFVLESIEITDETPSDPPA